MTEPDLSTCPWCGCQKGTGCAGVQWLCGSHHAGIKPYQSILCERNVLAKEVEKLRFQRDLLALNSWGFKNGIFIVHGNDGSVVDVVLNEDRTGSSDLITMPVQAEAAEAAKGGDA